MEITKALQPYGKDESIISLVVSHGGRWSFGCIDASKMNSIQESAYAHCYVHIKAKNPKIYIPLLDDGFKLQETKVVFESLEHNLKDADAIYFFLYYNDNENFIAMNYTTSEEEYDQINKHTNIISTVVFFGSDFKIIKEDWQAGIDISKKEVEEAIIIMKEDKALYE